jgi:hypothetical protein
MNIHSPFFILLIAAVHLFVSCPLIADSKLDQASDAVEKGEYKNAIAIYQELIKISSGMEKSELQIKLAQAYLKDQSQEKAFEIFIESLAPIATLEAKQIQNPTGKELELYNRALETYLKQTGLTSKETGQFLLQEYQPIVREHPDYLQLNFLIAAAHANLGSFDLFFKEFYSSYLQYPDHYMAYKTKAMLYVKLYEKEVDGENKKNLAHQIFNNTLLACEKYPQDSSLYKLLIAFSDDTIRSETITRLIRKLIDENIVVHRSEIHYYVKKAVEINQPALAQEFLNKAKGWYPQSRAIDAAENYLNTGGDE